MKKQKKSVLEIAFERHFKKKLIAAGYAFKTQKKIPGRQFRYDVYLYKAGRRFSSPATKILIEIDGHGLGHSSVMSLKRDAEKGNHAIFNGYLFFRLTTKHFPTKKKRRIPNKYAIDFIDRICKL